MNSITFGMEDWTLLSKLNGLQLVEIQGRRAMPSNCSKCLSKAKALFSLRDLTGIGVKNWGQAIVIKYLLFARLLRSSSNSSAIFLSDSSLPRLVSNSIIPWLILCAKFMWFGAGPT